MVADLVLAARLGWAHPVPLLATTFAQPALRARLDHRRAAETDPDWIAACQAGYPRGLARAYRARNVPPVRALTWPARDPARSIPLSPALPPEARWCAWMGHVEAVLFASAVPVPREALARVVGPECRLDALIADIRDELRARPYELVAVAGGWQLRTRLEFAPAIRAAGTVPEELRGSALTAGEQLVLAAVAYLQPVTRLALSRVLGKEVSRDVIARLKRLELLGAGPRSPEPGAPLTYVTTPAFLARLGLASLRDLPDLEALEEAGLLVPDEPADTLSDPFDAMLSSSAEEA